MIPARYASTRFPAKLLADLAGKPLLHWTCDAALQCGAERVVVATDDERIVSSLSSNPVETCLTGSHHQSGTERLGEVVRCLDWPDDAIVVNLQGDEPLMPARLVRQVAEDLARHEKAQLATLATPIRDIGELADPAVVKVVTDQSGYALTFSRAPIPWDRDEFADGIKSLPSGHQYLRHLGLYAYRAGFLRAYNDLEPTWIEQVEKLEQLRALWHGCPIAVSVTEEPVGHGVDTPEDLDRIKKLIN